MTPPPPPAGWQKVIDITYGFYNGEDGGNVGYWAMKDAIGHVQAWLEPNSSPYSFYVIWTMDGVWWTFANALSPNAGVPELGDGSGTFTNWFVETFTATTYTPGHGYVGTFNYQGTKQDILLGTYDVLVNGQDTGIQLQAGPVAFAWWNNYFTGIPEDTQVWTYVCVYRYKCQTCSQYDLGNGNSGTAGDIVIPAQPSHGH